MRSSLEEYDQHRRSQRPESADNNIVARWVHPNSVREEIQSDNLVLVRLSVSDPELPQTLCCSSRSSERAIRSQDVGLSKTNCTNTDRFMLVLRLRPLRDLLVYFIRQ